ncbi:SpvB/TcaC N-terminal domain-containing protein [Shewanella hanedai]|uniref:SpvB/TcaC N-terminal domain-containing protein n=1 Tax=Shewanella hanedai TaxID=25 RepID=UPI001E5B603B|nr:SpvB/TcaC N-terminal domain-containing protein [Shewanella hanedai]
MIVSASATDIDSDISSIQFSLNGESWLSTSNSSYSYNFGELQEGTHSIRAKVNTSTNQSAETPSKTFRVLPAVLVDINTIPDSTNSLVTAATNELVGEINGQASVDGGAFAYSVPITIAPGRNGVQPNISLNYSSQSGSGIAGLGWNLSAYSSISRCGQIYDLDQASTSAHYAADDKLCYNGSRLVVVSDPNGSNKGVYGSSGTYYKTERNGSVFIQQLGGDINSSSSYFVITDSNGTKHYLGKNNNSQIIAVDRNEPASWLQHQTEDRFGNQVDYLYDESVLGNRYIKDIFYTGFNGTAGNRKVHFNYVAETESRHYHWGGYSLSNKRLDSISVKIDDVEKALWQLEHSLTTDIEDKERAKLTTLSYCDGGDSTQCLTTNFNWLNKSYGHQKASSHSLDAIDDNYAVGLRVRKDHDYDGDGVLDLYIPLKGVYLSGSGALLDRTELPSISPTQPAGDLDYDGIVSINEKSSNVVNGSLDYDGDGRADFTYLNEHGELLITGINNDASIKFTHNTEIDATCYASVFHDIGDKFCESHAIDFNGDGRSDLLVATNKQAGTGNFQITYKSYLKNSDDGYSYNGEFTASAKEPLMPMDLDGDGILDLVPSSFRTALKWYKVGFNGSTDKMTFVEQNNSFNVDIDITERTTPSRWADLNGDGLSDVMTLDKVNSSDKFYTRTVIFNKGAGEFTAPTQLDETELAWQLNGGHIAKDPRYGGPSGYVYEQYAQFIDYNGDGRQDILYPDRSRRKYFYNCFDWSSNEECRAVDGADAPRFHDYDIWYWNVLITRPNGISFDKVELDVYGALATMNTLDINGDGRMDFVSGLGFESDATRRTWTYPTNGPREFAVFSHVDTQDNVINQVSTAMGTKVQIDYKQLKEVYSLDRVDNQYPYINFANTMRVVSGFDTDNGIGGLNHTAYQYENARFHVAGRGFQGFGAITETNNSAEAKHQTTTRTDFYQDFPWSGMVRQKQSEDYQGNRLSHYQVLGNAPSIEDYQVGESQCFYPANSINKRYVPELLAAVTTVTSSQVKNSRCQVITNDTVTSDSQVTHTKALEQSFTHEGDSLLSLPHVTTNVANVQYLTGTGANLDTESLKTHNSVTLSYQSNQHGILALSTSETLGLGSYPGIGATATYSNYDQYGHPLKVQTGNRWTATTMTSDGYFAKETSNSQWGATIASSSTFDPLTGAVLTATDVNGITATNVINFLGQVSQTSITRGGNAISPPVYVSHQWANAPYAFKTITRSSGTPEQVSYFDSQKRAVKQVSTGFSGNIITAKSYDSRGNLLSETEPTQDYGTQVTTTFGDYDVLGRAATKTFDNGLVSYVSTYTYVDGLTTDIAVSSNGYNLTMSRSYNSLKQLFSTVDAKGNESEFAYNAAGLPVLIQDVLSSQITAAYDDLGRKRWFDDPNMGKWSFVYNQYGELDNQTDARGVKSTYQYDQLGRLRNRAGRTFTYDGAAAKGRLYQTGFAGQTQTFSYDNSGRPTETLTQIDGLSFVEKYAYDSSFGRLKAMQYPSGEHVAYKYDDNGYVLEDYQRFDDNSERLLRRVDNYSAQGGINQQTFSNGLVQQFYRNSAGSPALICASASGNCDTSGGKQYLDYGYDAMGNLAYQHNRIQQFREDYTYDELMRVQSASISIDGLGLDPFNPIDYDYDAAGNIKVKTDYGSDYQYGNVGKSLGGLAGPNAIRQFVRDGATHQFTYDANGNRLSGDGATLTYNDDNKPVMVERNGAKSTFSYGADGMRFKQVKEKGGETTTTYYVGSYEQEVTSSATIEKTYIGDHTIKSRAISGTLGNQSVYQHVLHDRLGSVDSLIDARSAQILQHRGYDVFGRPRNIAAGNALLTDWQGVSRGFTDHEHLADQELIHMNGRVYDYNVGRFLSVDPFLQFPENSQSANPYSYILNNPMSGVDPTGYLAETDTVEAIGGPANEAEVKAAEEKVSGNGEQNEEKVTTTKLSRQKDNRSAYKVGIPGSTTTVSYGNNAAFAKGYSSIEGDMTGILSMTGPGQAVDSIKSGIDAFEAGYEKYQETGDLTGAALVAAKAGIEAYAERKLKGAEKAFNGGAFGKLKTGNGIERHHMPADSINGIKRARGPSIQMLKEDHKNTSSWGNSAESQAYKAEVKSLIKSSQMRKAMAMEVRDVKSQFGRKYNQATKEMLDYAKKEGYLNK